MRSYQTDSSEAMARILALSMLADGGIDQSEIEVIADTKILKKLGITGSQFQVVVHMLCEDMLQCMRGYDYGKIELDRNVIDQLLSEVMTPRLQKQLLRVMLAVVDADGKMSDGEAVLISQALIRWKCDLVDVSDGQAHQAYSSFSGSVDDTTVSSIRRQLYSA